MDFAYVNVVKAALEWGCQSRDCAPEPFVGKIALTVLVSLYMSIFELLGPLETHLYIQSQVIDSLASILPWCCVMMCLASCG